MKAGFFSSISVKKWYNNIFGLCLVERIVMNDTVRFLARYRRIYGLIFVLIYLLAAEPTAGMLVLGLVVMGVGAAFRAWASGYIHKDKSLATDGPYSIGHLKHSANLFYVPHIWKIFSKTGAKQ